MQTELKALLPVAWRLRWSRLKHGMHRDEHYYEAKERADFFRRAFRALQFNGISGDYAEFGSCGAATFSLAHDAICKTGGGRRLWAFDSFEGLPPQGDGRDSHPKWVPGDMMISLADFHAICKARGIDRADYAVVPGFYEETLSRPASAQAERPGDIALAYIDCDLYSSTLSVLEFLSSRLRHGMIIALDDYFCWSDATVSGERLALLELAEARGDFLLSPYLAFGWHGMSFVVERRASLVTDAASVARLLAAAPAGIGAVPGPADLAAPPVSETALPTEATPLDPVN
jgi:O-methyltransferase